MEKFSVVVASRDNDEEFGYFPWSFASALRLHPDDIHLCLDKPASERFVDTAFRLARNSNSSVIVEEVQKTDDWKFFQAKVHRQGYENAWHDRIIVYDIDTVLFPRILKGLPYVGKNDIAMVTFNKFPHIESLPTYIRTVYFLLKRHVTTFIEGLYWIYRPWYFEIIPENMIKEIVNGEDTLFFSRVEDSRYRLMPFKDFGGYELNNWNEEIPWRQFQDGVWYGANPRRGRVRMFPNNLYGMVTRTFFLQRPHMLKGWIWAKDNPNNEAVQVAKKTTIRDYSLLGKKYFKGYLGRGSGSEV